MITKMLVAINHIVTTICLCVLCVSAGISITETKPFTLFALWLCRYKSCPKTTKSQRATHTEPICHMFEFVFRQKQRRIYGRDKHNIKFVAVNKTEKIWLKWRRKVTKFVHSFVSQHGRTSGGRLCDDWFIATSRFPNVHWNTISWSRSEKVF